MYYCIYHMNVYSLEKFLLHGFCVCIYVPTHNQRWISRAITQELHIKILIWPFHDKCVCLDVYAWLSMIVCACVCDCVRA